MGVYRRASRTERTTRGTILFAVVVVAMIKLSSWSSLRGARRSPSSVHHWAPSSTTWPSLSSAFSFPRQRHQRVAFLSTLHDDGGTRTTTALSQHSPSSSDGLGGHKLRNREEYFSVQDLIGSSGSKRRMPPAVLDSSFMDESDDGSSDMLEAIRNYRPEEDEDGGEATFATRPRKQDLTTSGDDGRSRTAQLESAEGGSIGDFKRGPEEEEAPGGGGKQQQWDMAAKNKQMADILSNVPPPPPDTPPQRRKAFGKKDWDIQKKNKQLQEFLSKVPPPPPVDPQEDEEEEEDSPEDTASQWDMGAKHKQLQELLFRAKEGEEQPDATDDTDQDVFMEAEEPMIRSSGMAGLGLLGANKEKTVGVQAGGHDWINPVSGLFEPNEEAPFAPSTQDSEIMAQEPPPPPPKQYPGQESAEELKAMLDDVTQQIVQQNNGVEFNVNSPRQVAQVLYGEPTGTTNKSVLESMASAGNRMADLILQHRRFRSLLMKRQKQEELEREGSRVHSVAKVARTATTITSDALDSAAANATTTSELATDPLLLVDASALIFRAYHSMPAMHRFDGMPTGAVMGFCSTLNRLLLNTDDVNASAFATPPRMVMVFDSREAPNFRQILYPEYKAQRPEVPIDLRPQFDLVRLACSAYGIVRIEAPGFEADDVIATLATWASSCNSTRYDTNILSGDKDLMQLVTEHDDVRGSSAGVVHMIDPMTMARTTHVQVREKWGVPPSLLGDVLALAGDAADNVPGVPGIGPVTAAGLLQQFGSLQSILEQVDQIKQTKRRGALQNNTGRAKLSRTLVTLECHVPPEKMVVNLPPTDCALNLSSFDQLSEFFRMQPLQEDRIMGFYDEMGFVDLKRKYLNKQQEFLRHQAQQEEIAAKPLKRRRSKRRRKVKVPEPEEYKDVPF